MSWDDPHAWRASYDAWKLDAMDAYSYGDGPSMESVRELEDEMRGLVEENERLRAFVKTMLENDPNADAADGVSVLDVWRKEVLGAFPPPPAARRVRECEDCIGMKQHGCYCAAHGATKPGGPASDEEIAF